MKVTFLGAAGTVTGSKFIVETNGLRILLDCGTWQGIPEARERNRELPFRATEINYVILSHAHIDHCGLLPLLVKEGFNGSIFATPGTIAVAEAMLADAAAIEEQDAIYRANHTPVGEVPQNPLFTKDDIGPTVRRMVGVPYARVRSAWYEIAPGVRIKFYDAGHILGSATTVLESTEENEVSRLLYSGDIGSGHMPLFPDPEVPPEAVSLVMLESTYGGHNHKPLETAVDHLADVVREVASRRGKIIIPAFSLGRTQVLVYTLHKLIDEKKMPDIPIYVDSPLATKLTRIFRNHAQDFDAETGHDFRGAGHEPLWFEGLSYTESVAESKELNTKPGPFIVIAGSGMMTAGRVVHHLRQTLHDPKNAVFITGYQADGTPGRALIEGAKTIELWGDRVPVRASIHLFNEFSAHADQQELLEYVARCRGVEQVALVHGEPQQAGELETLMHEAHPRWQIFQSQEGETITVASVRG